jgi:hypothetical protein
MLYMICPTCGEPLGNKEITYISEMKAVCDSLGVDDDMISQSSINSNKDYIKKRQEIISKLVTNPCCKMRMMNYIDTVQLVKG